MNTQPHNAENGEKKILPQPGEIWLDVIHNEVEILNQHEYNSDRYECRKLKNGNHCYRDTTDLSYRINPKHDPVIPEHTFTESETLKILEALRQRCADEASNACNEGMFAASVEQSIEAIDLTQFLPPLNK